MNERVFDKSVKLADNAMLNHKEELFYQWNFEKNDGLGLDVYKATKGSNKEAWWNCPKCESLYDMKISERTGGIHRKGRNCPYCHGMRVNHTNSLASLKPELAAEWHPTLNGKRTPHDVVCGHNGAAWWLGECGHPWGATVNSRTNMSSGCPYCADFAALEGFNDMWTTNPELASLLANPEDGYKHMQSSGKRVDWKCSQCKNIIKGARIDNVNHFNLSCPKCSDGVKFPEKFIYNLLKEANIEFEFDTSQKWSVVSRYDFYLPRYNWIIETHGRQHYDGGFERMGNKGNARTLEMEVENDRLKKKMANTNGISNYIIIDARESTVEWIKKGILNSDITKIVHEIDFVKLGQMASTSFVKTACDLWTSGIHSTQEIGEEMRLDSSTILRYLKRGTEIGWCNYDARTSKEAGIKKSGYSRRKELVQLDMELNFICLWNSMAEAVESLNLTRGNVSSLCMGKRKSTGGFKWMYAEDYHECMLRGVPLLTKGKCTKSVMQFDINMNFIKTYDSLTEAAEANNVYSGSTISAVCRGKRKSAGGFRWMYEADYDLINNQKDIS